VSPRDDDRRRTTADIAGDRADSEELRGVRPGILLRCAGAGVLVRRTAARERRIERPAGALRGLLVPRVSFGGRGIVFGFERGVFGFGASSA